jgi:hypothetical protein
MQARKYTLRKSTSVVVVVVVVEVVVVVVVEEEEEEEELVLQAVEVLVGTISVLAQATRVLGRKVLRAV